MNPHPEQAAVRLRGNHSGGRDLVIGDLHGYFGTLEYALPELSFDPGRDRLFSVGDLIDRGPRSAEALQWLESGRITAAVRGNHEQMMVNALEANQAVSLRKSGAGAVWLSNGGDWWYDSEVVTREREHADEPRTFALAERWARALSALPYMMTIECGTKTVGVVHASGFSNFDESWSTIWDRARMQCARDAERDAVWHNALEHPLLWYDARTLVEDREDATLMPRLADIDLVVTGHSPGPHPRWARTNVICIDTGPHYDDCGHLTVAEVQAPGLRLHRFARSEGGPTRS